MAKGRKALPTAVKEARGSFVKDPQRRNRNEPKPKSGTPKMPTSLHKDNDAKRIWKRTIQTLDEMGILTTADLSVVEAYALNDSLMRKAHKEMLADGFGNRLTAAASTWHRCMDRNLKYLVELGLTPSSRSRIQTAPTEEADPFLEFLEMSKNSN